MHMADDEIGEILIGGESIHMVRHISLEKKMQMATELAQAIMMPNEHVGILTTVALYDVAVLYMIMKYYSDADLDDVATQTVFDWIVGNNAYDRVMDYVSDDFAYVKRIVDSMVTNFQEEFVAAHSLTHALRTSFGFLFDGRDITETLAEGREVSDQILDVVGRLNEAAKKEEAGRVKVAGNVINIGKKSR